MPEIRVLGRSKRFFYGWVIVGAGFCGTMVNNGLVLQGFGTFLLPLQDRFGWSKASLAGARSLIQVENGLVGPLEGFMIDRLGPRAVMGIGLYLLGLGMVLFSLIQSLWSYYAVFLVIAMGSSLSGFIVTATVINNWFRRNRTLAMSLAQTGLGFSGIVVLPLLVFAQNAFGWRVAAFSAGLCVWTLAIPICMLLRNSPERYGLLPDGGPVSPSAGGPMRASAHGVGSDSHDLTLREALRTQAFWFMGIAHGVSVMAITAVTTHQFAHMEMEEGVGIARSAAAVVVTVASVMNIIGRLVGGFLGDRMDKRHLAASGNALTAGSLVVLATAHSFGQAVAFGVMFGLAWGMRGPMMASIRGDFFGRAAFARISGTNSLLTMPFSMFGPIFAGIMADAQGEYRMAFLLLAGITAVGTPMFLALRQPRPSDRVAAGLRLESGPEVSPPAPSPSTQHKPH